MIAVGDCEAGLRQRAQEGEGTGKDASLDTGSTRGERWMDYICTCVRKRCIDMFYILIRVNVLYVIYV